MLKMILVQSLTVFSLALAGCRTGPLDSLCEARLVHVTPQLKQEFRTWLRADGHLRADAPKGAGRFLKDVKINNDLIQAHCGGKT